MQELVLSVKEMDISMKNMIEEQQSKGKRLSQIKTAMVTALASSLITTVVGVFYYRSKKIEGK